MSDNPEIPCPHCGDTFEDDETIIYIDNEPYHVDCASEYADGLDEAAPS